MPYTRYLTFDTAFCAMRSALRCKRLTFNNPPLALRLTPCALALSDLLDNPRSDQGQQNFMMPDQVDAPSAFSRGSVDDICQWAVMSDEIQIDRREVQQGIS